MSDFPIFGGGAFAKGGGFNYAASAGTTVASNATANTPGSFVDLITASENYFTSDWLQLTCSVENLGFANIFTSIAIGPAGDEEFIIPYFYWFRSTMTNQISSFDLSLPICIPEGARVSAQVQSSNSGAIDTEISIVRACRSLNSSPGLGKVRPYGFDLSNTSGQQVSLSVANTFSPWVELSSSLIQSVVGFYVNGGRNVSSWTDTDSIFQIAVGAAGDEDIVYESIKSVCDQELMASPNSPFVPVQIAEGERVSVRMMASVLGGSDANMSFIFSGVS